MTYETIGKNELQDEALLNLDAIWQTALWFANSDHEAEDLVMNTYVKASTFWVDTISKDGCKAQLFKVLMKLLFGKTRLNFRAHSSVSFENMHDSIPPDKVSEFETIPRDVIIGAIKGLPVEIRLVMVLSIFEKFSYQKIAEILGVHKKAVRLNIYQGYMLLRRDIIDSFAAGNNKMAVG